MVLVQRLCTMSSILESALWLTFVAQVVSLSGSSTPPVIVVGPRLKAVETGRNTVMQCEATGDPQPRIIWLKDDVELDLSENGRLRQLPGGSLMIQNAQSSDEGTYQCDAVNPFGRAQSLPANLYVRVRRVPPHFIEVARDVEVPAGGSVALTCSAVGNPMPYVSWHRGDVQLTPEDTVPQGRNVLELTDVYESATYTCVAQSSLGLDSHSVQLTVLGSPTAPEIVFGPSAKVVRPRQNTVMSCEATGDPQPRIIWLKDDEELDLMGSGRLWQLHGGSLFIENVQTSDEGTYQCEAVNPVGHALSLPANLYVRERRELHRRM